MSYWHNLKTPYFYYYRDNDQKEIDLIIEEGNHLHPIEFKKSASPSRNATKHFSTLSRLKREIGHGAVLSLSETDVPLSRTVDAIPAHYL